MIKVIHDDSRKALQFFPDQFFDLIITSPPYADARENKYDSTGVDDFPKFMNSFHEHFWRTLKDEGSFVLNIKDKVVNGVRNRYVWKTITCLCQMGWHCVDDYIWVKPNAMPGYWPNRLRDEWEYCFHLTKSKKFKMYQDTVKRPIGDWAKKQPLHESVRVERATDSGFGANRNHWNNKDLVLPGNVLSLPVVGRNTGHPAAFPIGIPDFFIKLFTMENDNVLDPFAGSGTTGVAAKLLNRNAYLIDSKKEYCDIMNHLTQ